MNEQNKDKSTEQIKQTKQMKEITSNIVAYENKIIEHLQAVTNLMVAVKKEHEDLQVAQGNIVDNIISQGLTNMFTKSNVQKHTDELNRLKKDVKELQRALELANRDKDCAISALETQQVYTNEIVNAQKSEKEKKEARLQGMKEKKLKERVKFIEYIHNYLSNPALNAGDNRVNMNQIVLDLHISDKTAITAANEIASGVLDTAYKDVIQWSKQKHRFKKR